MIKDVRTLYNSQFTPKKYDAFFRSLWEHFPYKIEFKVCETPVFIPKWLKDDLIKAGEEIVDHLVQPDFKKLSAAAIPAHQNVPGEDDHTTFLAIDFGICEDENGNIIPQLIEMQGFSSLYAHQHAMAKAFRRYFDIPSEMNHLFGDLNDLEYEDLFRRTLLGGHKAENVVLMDVEPHKQKTWVDFWDTRLMTSVEPVCISELRKSGNDIYYERNGVKIPVYRIFDRMIFDELERRKDLPLHWDITEPANIEWVSHPNWYFRISKYTLPFLKSKYVPETFFGNTFDPSGKDLSQYVLKPLYSFAGTGVKYDFTMEDLESLDHPEHFQIQKKVSYAPVVLTPDEPAKFEVRLMYIWEKTAARPQLVINLTRLSKGKMIGVNFNKNKDWVGGSVSFME